MESTEELVAVVEKAMHDIAARYKGSPLTQRTGEEISYFVFQHLLGMKYEGLISDHSRSKAECEFINSRTMKITARFTPAWTLEPKEAVIYLS